MNGTLQQLLAGVDNPQVYGSLRPLLTAIADRLGSQCLSSAGLAIKAGASPLVKAGAAFQAIANCVPVAKAINTDMAALSGTVTNATFNVYCFYIDSAGTLTTVMGTAGSTQALVDFPQTPQGKAMIGFVLINPTGTGDFVGNTTALDSATVVPNAVYVNTLGAFDPTVFIGQ